MARRYRWWPRSAASSTCEAMAGGTASLSHTCPSGAPQGMRIPASVGPEGLHPRVAAQSTLKVRVHPISPARFISGSGDEQLSKNQKQKERPLHRKSRFAFRPADRARTRSAHTQFLVPKATVVGNHVARNAGHMQPVLKYGCCDTCIMCDQLLLASSQRSVESRQRAQGHDLCRHPDGDFGECRAGVFALIVADEDLFGSLDLFEDSFNPVSVLRRAGRKVHRIQMPECSIIKVGAVRVANSQASRRQLIQLFVNRKRRLYVLGHPDAQKNGQKKKPPI